MDTLAVVILILSAVSSSNQVTLNDCIAEKFFRFNKDHTACVTKSDGATKSGVSSEDQALIVNKHNELRALQQATNMEKMVWDDEIASIAQRWADNCVFAHDQYRTIPGRFSVGQNLALGYSTWSNAIQGWYDEVDIFTYGREPANSFSAVGHYTQLVWAQSSKIGCGYAYCTNLNAHFYACNYGPAGNSDWWIPYKQGTSCADCPDTCDKNGLCDCGGKVCENGGALDLNTCECTCKHPWNIPGHCGLNCSAVTESTSCGPGGFYDGKCFIWSNVPDECPEACNICPWSTAEYELVEGPGDGGGAAGMSSQITLLLSVMSIYYLFC